ncbi:MAG: hypothetical protein NZ700_01915 [Gemmataceae bacterium]|nr:hypothetical protein [Gemmataceae bacterium]MDW8264834.1 hypothetical protein [Gemmataceae bacterium]
MGRGRVRRVAVAIALLVGGTTVLPMAAAGVYNPAETGAAVADPATGRSDRFPVEAPAGPIATTEGVAALRFDQFLIDPMGLLLRIGNEQLNDNRIRAHYLRQADRLRTKVRSGTATVPERVSLSAYLIRLGRPEEAVDVLTPVAGRDCRDFMVFANLGTATQLTGELRRAADRIQEALDYWPRDWPGMTRQQLEWYRQVERDHRRLLLLRLRERASGRARADETVDELFPELRFVGESGVYEAGQLAAAMREKLPADALARVQQLLVWLPADTRLYWLYGELLNAHGEVAAALRVLDECVYGRQYQTAELRAHRLVLLEAQARSVSPPDWLPGRRQLTVVGSLAGVVVVALLVLQVRELRRRWRGSASAKGCCR